jgi:hypothetical protein
MMGRATWSAVLATVPLFAAGERPRR